MAYSPSESDARIHRIIHNAKFEVEEIQRRHRQNETDADNLDTELEKMRIEGERIAGEVSFVRSQTTQYATECARSTYLLGAAENEKKLLEEKLARLKTKIIELDESHRRNEEENDKLMREYSEKFARQCQSWESLPYVRELRKWEKKLEEDGRRVEELRRQKAAVIARMEKRKIIEDKLKEFGSIRDVWVSAAQMGLRYEKSLIEDSRLGAGLATKKSRAEMLKVQIAARKEQEADAERATLEREAREKEKDEANRRRSAPRTGREKNHSRRSQHQQSASLPRRDVPKLSSSSSSSERPPSSKRRPDSRAVTDDGATVSRLGDSRNRPYTVPRSLQLPTRGPLGSPPRQNDNDGADSSGDGVASWAAMRTPLLELPSFLKIAKPRDVQAATPNSSGKDELPNSSKKAFAPVASSNSATTPKSTFVLSRPSSVSVPQVEVAPSFYDPPEMSATSEESPTVAGAEPVDNDNFFALDLSLNRSNDQQWSVAPAGLEDLSFNMDLDETVDKEQANIFGDDGDATADDFSFDL